MIPKIYGRDEHPISREDIDPDALKILYRLSRSGYKAYLVGGGVRDLLLNKKPKDFDIATDATPRKIKSLFSNSRVIGRRFKLVHIYFFGSKIIEVSTFRDTTAVPEPEAISSEDGLLIREDNTFGTEETDSIRRDITINALFYDVTNRTVIDYVGGFEDLKKKLVRVIGDSKVRFAEDPVRLLRVVRHAVRSDFSIEESCYQSLKMNASLILSSSPVRVYEELRKDIVSGYSAGIFRLLQHTGILTLLLPDITESMLLPDSELSESLARIDELVRAGEEYSSTLFFCVLVVFGKVPRARIQAHGKESSDLHHRFTDGEDVTEHVRSFFAKLSVPRKERERIESIISLWLRLMEWPEDEECRLSAGDFEVVDDVVRLLKVLPFSRSDRAVFRRIEQARGLPAQGKRRSQRRRRRSRARRTKSGESRHFTKDGHVA